MLRHRPAAALKSISRQFMSSRIRPPRVEGERVRILGVRRRVSGVSGLSERDRDYTGDTKVRHAFPHCLLFHGIPSPPSFDTYLQPI